MFEVAEIIYRILSEDATLSAIVGTKIFPLIADQDTQPPFVLYSVDQEKPYSKQGTYQYSISTSAIEDTYNDAAILSELLKGAMEAAPEKFMYQGGTVTYTEDNRFRITQNYEFKK